ncbi:pseudaminic acid synthase [Algibacter sp. L4_22]|uniref:pseudaminic acid synthase n=1 Tax=Algibacter sp. L4_22 TaxID=2942477 RepID=UPI00201B4975|nr:pseudaminic acid synthase [Algibacter sp. L4_22]MCL5127255.1 pseudaminic acid synthase [Algibacter sp. L4_22]
MKNSEELFIIAELSANHNNDLNLALKTIDAIAKTGANAVKIQTYTADSLTLDVDNEFFGPRKDGLWKGKTLYELFTEGSLPYEWHAKIKEHAESLGLVFFSSPFDKEGVDFLESLNVSLYKIASPEITDIPLIEYVASKGKPMIMSTGMASLSDIELAVSTCKKAGNNDVTLLKCTSEYPATPDMANLLTIPNLRDTFNVKIGLSDHSFGSTVPVVAVALGATVIEKHFVLDRDKGGIDAAFSMEPHEFADMVKSARDAQQALGKITYNLTDRNKLRRRSLFVSTDVKKGDKITADNIKSVRPAAGLHPKHYTVVLNKTFTQDVKKGTPLSFNLIS